MPTRPHVDRDVNREVEPTRAPRRRGRPTSGDNTTRDAILAAAAKVFAAKSFDAAPLRDIAAAAHVDVALISYQFGSKLGLWHALVDDLSKKLHEMLAVLKGNCAGLSSADTLRRGLGSIIDFLCDHPEIPHIMVRNFHRESERAEHVRKMLLQPVLEWMLVPMQALRSSGQLRPGYPEILYIHFAYSLGFSIVRRPHLSAAIPALADDAHFRATLRETLVESMFVHG